MNRIVNFLIAVILTASCQTLGGGEIIVSGKEFTIAKTGGDVNITTAGVSTCTLKEQDTGDSKHLYLYGKTINYEGNWYTFNSINDGKELHIIVNENTSTDDRILWLKLRQGDLYTKVMILQEGI